MLICLSLLLLTSSSFAASILARAKIIGVLTLPTEYSKYTKSTVVAWSRKGEIFFLNNELEANHSLTLNHLLIQDVVLGDKKLLVSGSATSSDGRSMQKVLLVDLLSSKVVAEWSTGEHKIFSIAFKEKQPLMVDYNGDLFALAANNKLEKIKNLRRNSFYIPIVDGAPIICTSQDIMDEKSKPSVCRREGQNNWSKMGQWLGIMKPFVCGGFLIEPGQGRSKQLKNQIVVRDIQDGSVKKQKDLPKLIAVKCAEDKLVYVARHVYIASLPDLTTLSEESCGNQRVKDLALVGDSLICVNQSLKFRKQQVSQEEEGAQAVKTQAVKGK